MSKILNIISDKGVILKDLIPQSLENLANLGYELVIVDSINETIGNNENTFASLKSGQADIAILHLPDLPPLNPFDDLVIGALSERNNAQESIIINENYYDLQGELRLKDETVVHVLTNIQAEQLKKLVPTIQTSVTELSIENLVKQVNSGEINAAMIPKIILDVSQNIGSIKSVNLHPKELIPAPGQGIFAFVTHKENLALRKLLKLIHQKDVAENSNVERKVRQMLPIADQQNLAVYCYKDANANFHAVGTYLSSENMTLRFSTHSQSTSEGMSENIFNSIYHK